MEEAMRLVLQQGLEQGMRMEMLMGWGHACEWGHLWGWGCR